MRAISKYDTVEFNNKTKPDVLSILQSESFKYKMHLKGQFNTAATQWQRN